MKNLVRRSRFSGYKGMDRIGRESSRNLKDMGHKEDVSRHEHTGNAGSSLSNLFYYVYVQSEGNKPYVVSQFYYDNEKGHKQPTETFRPDVKWVDYYVSTGDGALDFKIDTRVISDDTVIKDAKGNILATDNSVTDTNIHLKPSTMAAPAKANNPFIGDNFFNANPEKVLGTQTIEHGRFGNEIIKVKGDFSNIEKIDVPAVQLVDLYPQQVFATENKEEIIQQVFDNVIKKQNEERLDKLRSPNKKTKKQKSADNLQATQEVYSFREFSDLYNKDISRDEMEAYYFTHPELNYKLLLDEIKMSKQEMLDKGLICWDEGKLVYVYTYQSGNISKKIASLQRDKEKLVALTSEEQYEKQMQMLLSVKPKSKGLVGDDRLMVLPHSNFAKSIKITELRGKPELNAQMSLTEAFKKWLRVQPPDMFDKSGYIEIIDYYIDNKVIPIDKNSGKVQQVKDEKKAINIRQRTKEEGDKLFGIFLAEELIPEDQAKVAYLWNEKYNAFAEPNLAKTPVCLKMAKTFKAGAPLILNPTQRQAAAFMQEKKSGLLAYSVGVGKTIASILCMGQAFYNGFCKKPIFVVPTNTYPNWIAELQGANDSQTGVFMQGLMPQLPPVVGLYNLNPVIVKEQLKVYSKEDERQFEKIEEVIAAIRKLNVVKNFTADQVTMIQRVYPINIRGIEAEYDTLMLENDGKGTGRAKNFPEFLINYLKDEYNYYIYQLGSIKDFPDGTIFVTTENGLQRLGVSEDNKYELESSLYEILSQGEKTADGEGSGGDRAKEIAKLQLMIKQRISSSMKNAKLNIEDLQLDWLCMDEAHYYKKLFTFVKGDIKDTYEDSKGNTKYDRDKTKYELKSGGAPSGRALSAFVVSHFIQMRNDNRNVVLLTATPFTNSPLEVYSMMVLTNLKALQEMGLGNMTEFFDTFMKINYDIKYTPQKTVKKDIVLTGYNNLSNLRQVIYSMMDKKDEGANLKRPIKLMYPSMEKGIETTIPMTAEQDELIRLVKDYIQDKGDLSAVCQESVNETLQEIDFDSMEDEQLVSEWEKYTQKDYEGDRDTLTDNKRDNLISQIRNIMKKQIADGAEFTAGELAEEESLGVRILRGISMMKQITLSPFLFHKACSKVQKQSYTLPGYKEFITTSPKLKYTMGCIKSVIDFHKERQEKISGQVIYMANGVEYFPLVKEYLVKELHLKESEVGIVSGGMSKSAKESVKAKFLNGDCLVLIGSQTISVGVNLQNNATVLYNLWFDWNPTDAAQIEGRIWRQGNRFKYVRIVYPMCYNSCDPVIFEYLNSKTLRINEIWNRSSEIQELDLKDFNPKELQKKLITDPEEKAEWEILEESDKINGEILYYENRRDLLVNALTSFKNFTRLKPMAIKEMNSISAKRAEIKKADAIKRNSEKLVKITEEFAAEPEKMVAEIQKFNAEKYDHANDPDGKYIPTDYTEMTNLEIVEASGNLQKHLNNVDYTDSAVWGDLYWEKQTINETLNSLRYNYKDLRTAEERVLTPMGISFDSATNPINEFDQKLRVLTERLNAIEDGKEEKIARYRKEYLENLKTIKTVDDRIAEFAAANEELIPPQLVYTNTEPVVEDIPHEEVKPVENIQQNDQQPAETQEMAPVPIDSVIEQQPHSGVKELLKPVLDERIAKTEIRIIDGVEFSLVPNVDGSLEIERVFIPEGNRGKHLLSPALQKLVADADEKGITLMTTVFPDEETDENYEKLRSVFNKAGFKADEFDGEVYRNDLTREPKQKEQAPTPVKTPVFGFMSNSPMHQGKALSVLEKRIRDENNKVLPIYKWIEEMPAGLEVETIKINSSKSDKGYTDKMVIGNHIVGTKAEQEYYKYLQAGGESYSVYLEKKKVYDDIIAGEKAAERKIADDKRKIEQDRLRENAKIAKQQIIKSLILDGKEPLIEKTTKYFKNEIERLKKGRQTAQVKTDIETEQMYIDQAIRQANDMYTISTKLYRLDEDGNVQKKFNWQVGDAVLYYSNSDNYIKTQIDTIRENIDDTVSYKVQPAEGIFNNWIGYDGLFPVTEKPVEKPEEDFKTTINNQIEALTLAREFAGEDELAEIDSQIEALTISLDFI